MVNQELISYIQSELLKKTPKENIYKSLTSSGWLQQDIDEIFEKVASRNSLSPTPSPTSLFVVPYIKLVLFMILIPGLYEIYWINKQWIQIKKIKQNNIHPILRTILSLIWVYPLLREISLITSSSNKKPLNAKLLTIIIYSVLAFLPLVTSGFIYNLIISQILSIALAIANILITLYIQKFINNSWEKDHPDNKIPMQFSLKVKILLPIFGIIFLINLYLTPSTLFHYYKVVNLKSDWQKYSSTDNNYSILFPDKPISTNKNYVYEDFSGKEHFSVVVTNLDSTSVDLPDQEKYLDTYLKANLVNNAFSVNPETFEKGTYQGYPSVEANASVSTKIPFSILLPSARFKFILIQNTLYQLANVSTNKNFPLYKNFVDSFQLIKVPSRTSLYYLNAQKLYTEGKYQDQLTQAQNGLNISSTDEEKGIGNYWIGLAYYKVKDESKSKQYMETSTQLFPKNPGPYVTLSAIAMDSNDYQKALNLAQTCASLDPTYGWCENDIGLALFGLNRKDEAIIHLQKATQLDPNSLAFKDNLTRASQLK